MKYIISLIFLVFTCTSVYAAPKWFSNHNIPSASYEIIGYGSGKSKEAAFYNAAAEISSQIMTNVVSNFQSTTSSDGASSQTEDVTARTEAVLKGLSIIKFDNEDDLFYCAVKFINLPLASLVAMQQGADACQNTDTGRYINKTYLGTELKDKLGCIPRITWYNTAGVLYAEINGRSYLVPSSDFLKFFSAGGTDQVSVKSSKLIMKPGETYRLNINVAQKGYLSIFQINQSGSVNMLLSNKDVSIGNKVVYPDPNKYDGLEAELPDNHNNDKDLSIAILCNDKIDTGIYDEISTKVNLAGAGLMSLLKATESCDYYTVVTEVRK